MRKTCRTLQVCVCVCVKHLNRCKTSTFTWHLNWCKTSTWAGGQRGLAKLCPTKLFASIPGSTDWSFVCTCQVVITCCSGSASNFISFRYCHGYRLSPEPARRFTTTFKPNFILRNLFRCHCDGCTVFAICQCRRFVLTLFRVCSSTRSCQV